MYCVLWGSFTLTLRCVRSCVCARGSVLSELPLKILWEGAVLKVNLLQCGASFPLASEWIALALVEHR